MNEYLKYIIAYILINCSSLSAQNVVEPIRILQNETFVVSYLIDSIPKNVIISFGKLTGETKLANPNQLYNATDIIRKELPRKRLIFFGKSTNYQFIAYEQGGRGKQNRIIIFHKDSTNLNPVWGGSFTNSVSNLTDLIKLITLGKVEEVKLGRIHW